MEQWDDFAKDRYDSNRGRDRFRPFTPEAPPGVREFYRLNHTHQTRAFVERKKRQYLARGQRNMGIWESLEYLNSLVDDSDPSSEGPAPSRLSKILCAPASCRLLLIVTAVTLFAQPPLNPADRLARAREILVERDIRLPDYTCVQTLDRRYLNPKHKHGPAPACGQGLSSGPSNLVLQATDRLRLDLKVSQGVEIGSWAGSQFDSRSIFDLVGGGPYGTGMLGALISDTFVRGGATYRYIGEETNNGTRVYAYSYQVPAIASHYQVRSGSGWTPVAFSGSFWLDSESLELKRLTSQSRALPPESGACESATTVDYQKLAAGNGAYLLPQQSSTEIEMQDGTETRMTAVYSGCRQYRGEATIRFDEAPTDGGAIAAAAPPAPLPAGLEIAIALTEPIDTDTAAAGDMVKARIRKAVRDRRSKAVLVPEGAMVQARIVQMQHWLIDPPRFVISIALEKLEEGGAWRALYAKAESRATVDVADVDRGTLVAEPGSTIMVVPPKGQPPQLGAFLFPTERSHYRVPAGYASDWTTIEPTSPGKN